MSVVQKTEHGTVYTRPGSRNLWIFFTRSDGSSVRKSAGTDRVDAAIEALAKEYKRQSEITFKAAVVDFFEVKGRSLKPGTILHYKDRLKVVDQFFGRKYQYLADINRVALQEFVSKRRKEVSDTTVRRDLAFLSTVFTHAIDNLPGAPESNPVIAFSKKSMKERVRDRWLTRAEYERLLRACFTEMHRDIVSFACHTGLRHGELTALRKPMIDLDNRRVILSGSLTKNSKPRIVPLSPDALCTAERLCRTAPGDLFFWHQSPTSFQPSPFGTFTGFFKKARGRAGLDDVRFHDLRHTFASWYVQAGGRLETLQRILGHGTVQMVQRYAYLDMDSAHAQADEIFAAQFLHNGGNDAAQ